MDDKFMKADYLMSVLHDTTNDKFNSNFVLKGIIVIDNDHDLPEASEDILGDTYCVMNHCIYKGKFYHKGTIFVCNGDTWTGISEVYKVGINTNKLPLIVFENYEEIAGKEYCFMIGTAMYDNIRKYLKDVKLNEPYKSEGYFYELLTEFIKEHKVLFIKIPSEEVMIECCEALGYKKSKDAASNDEIVMSKDN